MEKIESFKIDHTKLLPGLYLSRRDSYGGAAAATFDLRFTAPNREPPLDCAALHTIEHLGATFLRNCNEKDKIIYFGPMGCRTGFYLVVFGSAKPQDILPLVIKTCEYIISFKGEIPGATEKECGNYLEQNLTLAKYYARRYLKELKNNPRLTYPV